MAVLLPEASILLFLWTRARRALVFTDLDMVPEVLCRRGPSVVLHIHGFERPFMLCFLLNYCD